MSRALATRHLLTGAPIPNRLQPGQEVWEDYPHRLAARVAHETRRGYVLELSRWELPGAPRHIALVLRLKPRPTWRTRARSWALLGTLGLGVAYVLGWMVWTVASALFAIFPALLGGAVLSWLLYRWSR